jgi:RNA-binding protein
MNELLTSKQRAMLRAMANAEDPILHIGKGEISPALIKQADDALKARELIKGRVLETCAHTPVEAAGMVAAEVNAEVVQVMGRTFVLYRKSEKTKIRL